MNQEKDFSENKITALKKLDKARNEKLVDEKILPILDLINKSENFYTSSSCSGRIVLLEIPAIGDKKNAVFLGKWHRNIKPDEIITSLKNAKTGQLWLLAQSPIIHVSTKTNMDAENILKTAISSGFKNSGIKSIGKKIVVEILSTERIDVPVGQNAKLFCDESYLKLLIKISNEIIDKSTLKIDKLLIGLKKKI